MDFYSLVIMLAITILAFFLLRKLIKWIANLVVSIALYLAFVKFLGLKFSWLYLLLVVIFQLLGLLAVIIIEALFPGAVPF